jgi:hypothetical protein
VRTDLAPYLVAEVDPYPDEPPDDTDATDELAGRVTRRFVDYLRLLQPRDGESAEPIDVQMEVEMADDADDGDPGEDEDEDEDEEVVDGVGEGRPGGPRAVPLVETDARPVPIDDTEAATAALRIPDDPSALSYLLTGIIQVEADRKQALLEAAGAEERLRDIDALLDRELLLLGARLAPFAVDRRELSASAN